MIGGNMSRFIKNIKFLLIKMFRRCASSTFNTDNIDGGVKTYCSGEDSPKVIKSTEIISFKCEVSLYSVVLEKESKLVGRNYKLSAALENGNVRCTVEWHDRAGSKEKYDFTTDASFMINVQEIAAKYNFARFNGYISKVSGLPDMYGAKLDITYASNETIYAYNNQDMFIPFEAVEDLVEIFNCEYKVVKK